MDRVTLVISTEFQMDYVIRRRSPNKPGNSEPFSKGLPELMPFAPTRLALPSTFKSLVRKTGLTQWHLRPTVVAMTE